jgi:hypothetical protein
MPTYVYQAEDGSQIERLLPMKDKHPDAIFVDKNGEEMLVYEAPEMTHRAYNHTYDFESGKEYRRVFGNNFLDDRRHAGYPYPSLRLAGRISEADAEHVNMKVRGVPQENVPVIQNPQHEREIAAKYGLKRE